VRDCGVDAQAVRLGVSRAGRGVLRVSCHDRPPLTVDPKGTETGRFGPGEA
jgi:hypothetical protein